ICADALKGDICADVGYKICADALKGDICADAGYNLFATSVQMLTRATSVQMPVILEGRHLHKCRQRKGTAKESRLFHYSTICVISE
ncbi:hypothetical protein, partial [Bosea sp. (in: a-proteobacteria)]|uniref:hypothetical protein n=1 Tax=Bosea sp. (in: a-proteobacteria) TaxID=1871050 RepID=UPI004034CFEC